jgi:hypothetical protein
MVIVLEGPRPTIDVVLQDYLKAEWPTVGNPDTTKLQTTAGMIDWGKDYDEQTSQRCAIRVDDIRGARQGSDTINRKLEYGATMTIRVLYRDADNDQPPELWNIGEEVASIMFRASVTRALRSQGIHDLTVGDFEKPAEHPQDIQELHEYTQQVTAYFYKTGKEIV